MDCLREYLPDTFNKEGTINEDSGKHGRRCL
jgi:hypothetical protein